MVEFFPDDYHIYGARRATPTDLLWTAERAHEDLGSTVQVNEFKLRITIEDAAAIEEDNLSFDSVTNLVLNTANSLYAIITSQVASVWADLAPNSPLDNSRSGVATDIALPTNASNFLEKLARVPVLQADRLALAAFITSQGELYKKLKLADSVGAGVYAEGNVHV